jgi:DNA polymerase III alpha subunit (gram-positive type)
MMGGCELAILLTGRVVLAKFCTVKTKIFKSGNSLAVRLPKSLELRCGTVSIHRDGSKIIIEEATSTGWPTGFFDEVKISRESFGRDVSAYQEKVL